MLVVMVMIIIIIIITANIKILMRITAMVIIASRTAMGKLGEIMTIVKGSASSCPELSRGM